MRSALLFVFFALIIERGSRASDDDFKPIPIPLDEWNYERRESRVGTLHETIRTEQPPLVAAVPAHYWEDALRHSVYLTLVRDKIDQLIAKGVVVSPNSKPEQYVSKEVDDHDLWERIKQAPFDRIQEEDSQFGDITIMAKGRLIEDKGGFRFTEDERSKEECSDEKCLEGVKAFWSVKRVRQRDVETSPGRYHYELTFSVNSQPPKKQKRPYENPVRTFTVRENAPDTLVGTPQEYPVYQPARPQVPRPQRAVWFHKNIAPKQYNNQGRYYNQGLDRIFSSFFFDDESHAEPPPRFKPNPYAPPVYPQYSKVGYVGMPSDHHQQKRLMSYPYKPNGYKYRPPLPAPPVGHIQQHYTDADVISHQYPMQPPDHRYISPSNIVKTTRPAVMPTPPMTYVTTTSKDVSLDNTTATTGIEETTKITEMPTVYKTYTKQRPVQVSYFSEHVRPPVYNAPPGVFVTMEKKPFKPMPPLKFTHPPKHHKRPINFRPSPQLIDGQLFSNPETPADTAFRPILVNNSTDTDIEDIEVTQSIRHGHKHLRKQTSKKPPKKHENIKSQRITTTAPDIITVNNEENDMQWVDLWSAFTKTTPMGSQKAKNPQDSQVDSSEVSTPAMDSLTKNKTTTTEVYEEKTTTTTTTTTMTTSPAPRKRTRPPHKFVKPEKVKKHKRITTTTKAPEKLTLKKPSDLTPQASSAATGAPKSWKPKNKTTTPVPTTEQPSTTSTSTTIITSTTTPTPTTKSSYVETTAKTEIVKPSQPKNKNRFRISTLMQKGTSVKHDRWSVNVNNNTTDKKITISPTGKYPPRRKGSNFQGYVMSSTSKYSGHSHEDEFHKDYYSSRFETSTTTEASTAVSTQAAPATTQPTYDDSNEYYHKELSENTQSHDDMGEDDDDDDDNEDIDDKEISKGNKNDQEEAEDHSEFIFGLTSTTPSERTNEIIDDDMVVTEQSVITTILDTPQNKTKKCRKKKKNDHLVSTTTLYPEDEVLETTTLAPTSTKSSTGIDLLDEILSSLNYEDTTEKAKGTTKPLKQELDEEESENHEKYLKIDEDFEEFLGNLGGKNRHPDELDDVEYQDEHEALTDDDVSPFDNEDTNETSRETNDKDYDDYRERSYSLLELMAME